MLVLAEAGFDTLDWVVLGGYVALLVGTGIFFSLRQQKNTEEYFLGGHRMPVWAVAFSILATAQSAATYVGAPESAYRGDLAYLSANIGGIIAAILLATVFIPAYYRNKVTTPYQLLETRFGAGAKEATSLTYMVGRVFAGGARLFIGALPASQAVFGDTSPGHVLISIAVFMVFGILYTLWGGISSVIWTDVIQVCVYLGAALAACLVILHRLHMPLPDLIQALAHPPTGASKLTVFHLGIDPSQPHLGFNPSAGFTVLTAVFGLSLLSIASYGADQDLVQRMLTCKSPAHGSWSVISGVLVGIPAVCLFLALGLLLYLFYYRPDLSGAGGGEAPPSERVVMTFAMTEMRGGLAGLVLAGLLAAGPCGINSSLNSMSSTFVSDFYRPRAAGKPEAHYLAVSRMAVVAAGLLVGGFAAGCIGFYNPKNTTLLDLALGVMSFAYAGLLGVFFTALFTRRGSVRSVIAAILVGFVVVFLLQPSIWSRVMTVLDPSDLTTLKGVSLAFPWQLCIGAVISFLVCVSAKAPPKRNVCASCGYEMVGLTSSVCPECGTSTLPV